MCAPQHHFQPSLVPMPAAICAPTATVQLNFVYIFSFCTWVSLRQFCSLPWILSPVFFLGYNGASPSDREQGNVHRGWKKVPLQLCESRKTFCKNLQCAEATHLKTSIPPLTSSTRNLLNGLIPLKPSSFQTCVKNGPQHSHAKVAGALASPLLADVFRENWWQPRTITIWPQSVFPDAPSSTLMHARHSLMKWLSKTRYAFSSLLSSFTCYFHRLEYSVHCSSHPCLFIDYGVVFWLAWDGGGLRLQCHCLRPLCNQPRNYSYLDPTASLACLYSSAPCRTLGSRD